MASWIGVGCALCVTPLQADLSDLRVWPHKSVTRVVLEADAPLSGDIFTLSAPDRIVVDVTSLEEHIDYRWEGIPLHGAPIDGIRIGHHGDASRLVLPLSEPHRFTSFQLPPDNGQGYRWVVDLHPTSVSSEPSDIDGKQAADATPAGSTPGAPPSIIELPSRVVVIDPGHGGRDPGAIGPSGTYEKDVVLAISHAIKERIDAEPGIDAVLTRHDDTFIGLRERTRIARRSDASMFVSIHADAAPRRSAQGGSVYVLSPRGASSETAKWLVANEQQSVAVTAEDLEFLNSTEDGSTRQALLDLSIGQSIQQSVALGEEVLKALDHVGELHKPNVERANFAVLRSPDIPSLLVETGFISNQEEEARLRDPQYQAQMGEQIADAIIAAMATLQ